MHICIADHISCSLTTCNLKVSIPVVHMRFNSLVTAYRRGPLERGFLIVSSMLVSRAVAYIEVLVNWLAAFRSPGFIAKKIRTRA